MMTPDGFTEAVNKSMADVRTAMSETAERLEAEFRRLADATGMDEAVSSARIQEGNEQLREMLDALRDEAVRAAGQLSEGMGDMLAEFRRMLDATMPGWAGGAEPEATAVAKKAVTKKATKKTAKKSAKKALPKKTLPKKSTKKATAKKATAKKATKKAAKKAPAKKAAAKTTKKATKKTTKKAGAKKSAKKTTKKAR